ncbi:MAG: hypothetical protein WA667_00115, partial [Candidatus Nitrosopolaris sp.]
EILSTNEIALLQNVSESRIRQIWCQYRNTMTVPILAKPGRPSRSITKEEISAIIGTYKEYPCSAVVLAYNWGIWSIYNESYRKQYSEKSNRRRSMFNIFRMRTLNCN